MRLTLLCLLLLTSCADPNYVTDNLVKNRDQLEAECALFFQEEQLCLTTKWVKFPTESEVGLFTMHFHEKDRPDILITPKLTPHVVLWMPSMGHGSSPVSVEFASEGIFHAKEVYFIMPGPWDIRYQLKEGNRVVEEVIQKITI